MGVTYKFTDEVVTFVLEQKQKDPNLSCRKLADIVQKEFQLIVSKSAINNILKNSQLSSPVGRRSIAAKTRKFSIPSEKKSEIFGKEASSPAQPKPAKPPAAPKASSPPVVKPKPKPKSEPKSQPTPVAKGLWRPAVAEAAPDSAATEVLCDGMGAIFLKAAEWELGISQAAGSVLKDYVAGFSPEDICAASQALIFLPVFGFQRPEDLARYTGQGLWLLNGLSTKFDYRSLVRMMNHVHDQSFAAIKVVSDIQQALAEIAQINITLEDGASYSIDGEFVSLMSTSVQSEIHNSQYKVLSNLSKCIIHNLSPLILNHAPGETCLSKEFFELSASFENIQHERMTNVSLLDGSGQEMAVFDMVPSVRRVFITAIWPRQKEFDRLSSGRGERFEELFMENIGKSFAWMALSPSVVCSVFSDENFRCFWVQGPDAAGKEQQVILVTNALDQEIAGRSVVEQYLNRWPNIMPLLDENGISSQDAKTEDGNKPPEAVPSDIAGAARNILEALNNHCVNHFFPLSKANGDLGAMTSRFFALPGSWQQTGSRVVVRLNAPDNATARMELVYAVNRLNEREVFDPHGRRLWVGLA